MNTEQLNTEYISTTQVMARIGVSRPTVIKMLKSGRLEGIRFGEKWLVSIAGLERYIAANSANSAN